MKNTDFSGLGKCFVYHIWLRRVFRRSDGKKKQFSRNIHSGGQAVKAETIMFYDETFVLKHDMDKKLFCFYTSWHNSS